MSASAPQLGLLGAILAGGAGSRLGGDDKGLRLLHGRPLIEWVATVLRPQVDSIVIVCNRNPDAYAPFGRVVADTRAGFLGPLAGIATALAGCEFQSVLTVPVDAPLPPLDLARRLSGDALAAVAHDGTRRQPLFARYDRALAVAADDALARDCAVWQWQDAIGAREIDFSDAPERFANLNTPEDFRDWERRHV